MSHYELMKQNLIDAYHLGLISFLDYTKIMCEIIKLEEEEADDNKKMD